jgi:hypothetical protein
MSKILCHGLKGPGVFGIGITGLEMRKRFHVLFGKCEWECDILENLPPGHIDIH